MKQSSIFKEFIKCNKRIVISCTVFSVLLIISMVLISVKSVMYISPEEHAFCVLGTAFFVTFLIILFAASYSQFKTQMEECAFPFFVCEVNGLRHAYWQGTKGFYHSVCDCNQKPQEISRSEYLQMYSKHCSSL